MNQNNLWNDYVAFHKEQMRSWDIDPVYPVLKHIIKDVEPESGLWLTFLHVAYYNIGSALAVWHRYPMPTLPEDDFLKYPCGTERRAHRSPEKLKKHFGIYPGFSLKNTHLGSGHEMDFSMQLENNYIMWELKHYSTVVPKAEVDKFLRDLKENPQTNIGVMISRTTDIYGKYHSGHLFTEFDGDKMMIYLNLSTH